MTEQSKTTPGHGKSVAYYVEKIEDTTRGTSYVYRGQANEAWQMESGAARRIKLTREGDDGSLLPSISMVEYQNNLLTDARQKGFGLVNGRRLPDLELLTELQHFGAATCLLDFTKECFGCALFCMPVREG